MPQRSTQLWAALSHRRHGGLPKMRADGSEVGMDEVDVCVVGAGPVGGIGAGELRSRLVVAAEGRGSPLRQQAGIAVTTVPYRQRGIVCAVAHERPHGNTALEHFLPTGPFAQLPMVGHEGAPNVSAIVWTERQALADRLIEADDAVFAREVRRRLGPHLGDIRP